MSSYGSPQFGLPRLSAVVKKLIITLFAAYIVQLILEEWMGLPVVPLLELTPAGPGLWQLATYVLVYTGHPLMFLIGLLFMWWAFSPFEIGYGSTRALQLCGVALLSASVPAYLIGFVLPTPFFKLAGSAPLWLGAIAAMTWLHRHQQIALFGALRMTAQQFLWLLLGMTVLMFIASKNYVQLIAELGAMAGGIGFVRWMKRPRAADRKSKSRARGFKVIQGGNDDDRPKWLN